MNKHHDNPQPYHQHTDSVPRRMASHRESASMAQYQGRVCHHRENHRNFNNPACLNCMVLTILHYNGMLSLHLYTHKMLVKDEDSIRD